jgi:energy-coupling factor transporter ATP-binding protein EcfA2
MEKINSFTVSKLSVSGFKCFGGPKEFDFGKVSMITGHNGMGKSSIADAIAYAITGAPYFGDGRLDRLYSIGGANAIRAELEIELPDGSVRRIVRERAKDRTEITLDGLPIRQTDLTAGFGEKDVFLSVFNPLYFAESLGENGRNLLERYLPSVPREKVLETLCDEDRRLLAGECMTSPEGLLRSLREETKAIESDIVYTEGQRCPATR